MCTVPLPPGDNPIAVNKCIISYRKIKEINFSRKDDHATVCRDHACAFIVCLLDCDDTVTAESYCGTLKGHGCLFVAKITICAIVPRPTYRRTNLRLTTALELGGLSHPLYTADLEPSDFRIVGSLKKYLTGKKFATDADVKQAVIS